MTYDEIELEAMVREILDECDDLNSLDDEELFDIIEKVKVFTDDDVEEAYEYLSQYSSIDRKRIIALYAV